MSPERWRKLEELYDAAAELPAEERERFLDEQCGADQDLRRELGAMFASAGAGLTGVVEHAAASVVEGADAWIGQRLGPYRIVRPIGQGGMGAVYEGVREDAFQQRVAIKLVKYSFDSPSARRRFQRERQILARLGHPNIARLLDGGDYDGRVPYLVMEFVEGEPLLKAALSLDVRGKLRLFQKILSAVSYAHGDLVVHRDIKPANILVSRTGEPKLLDFGIARLIDEEPGGDGPRTMTMGSMMTPDYASPEQVKGEPAGVASDVYSLGAMLYELLSGARPHALESYSTAEVYRAVCETEPRPPSERTADPRLKRELHGDIDALVLHALAKTPAARYTSADVFRREIDRYLDGRPLTVSRASRWKRAWKFVKRNRLAVGAAAAVAASLVGGITVSTLEARDAQRRFAQVREMANTFLFQFYDQVTPLPGSTAVRASIVDTARKYLDGLAAEAGNDKGLLLELASAYERLGSVQGRVGTASLGRVEDARRSYQHALELYGRLGVNSRSPLDLRRRNASVLWMLGRLEFGGSHWEPAETAIRRAMDLLGDGAPDPEARRLRASAESSLGEIRLKQGRAREALALIEAAQRVFLDLQASGHADPQVTEDIANTRTRIAQAKASLGDLDGSMREFEELLRNPPACNKGAVLGRPCQVFAVRLTTTADAYGAVDRPILGDLARAAALYERAIGISERLVEQDPNDRNARYQLALRNGKLGDVLSASDPKRALALYERAMTTAQALASKEQIKDIRSSYLSAICRPLPHLGRFAEARKAFDTVIAEEGWADAHAPYADRLQELSARLLEPPILVGEGRAAEARKVLLGIIRITEGLRAERPDDFTPVFFLCQEYRMLAGMSAGQERRDALLRSVATWRSWPETSFTRRELEKDLAAAAQ